MKWIRRAGSCLPMLLLGVLAIWIFVVEAAVIYVSNASNQAASGNAVLSAPSGCSQNLTVLVAWVSVYNTSSPTITNPTGWTTIGSDVTVGSYIKSRLCWALYNTALTYTWTIATGANWGGGIMSFDNADPTQPIDVYASNTGASGTQANTAAITTSYGNEMCVFVYSTYQGARSRTWSSQLMGGAAMTQSLYQGGGNNPCISLGGARLSKESPGSTGTFNATVNNSTVPQGWTAFSAAIKGPIVGQDGAPSSAELTASGSGEVLSQTFTATGACEIGSLTAAGTGAEGVFGTGACTVENLTCSGVGKILYTATGVLALLSLTLSGTGLELFRGSSGEWFAEGWFNNWFSGEWFVKGGVNAEAPTAVGEGTEIFSATGAANQEELVAAGTGDLLFSGSGSCSVQELTASGVGMVPHIGSGSPQTEELVADGDGTMITEGVAGTGECNLEALTASASGAWFFAGSGTPNIDSLVSSGSGKVGFFGSIARWWAMDWFFDDEWFPAGPTIDNFVASGVGEYVSLDVFGSGAPQIEALVATGSGLVPMIGSGSMSIENLTAEGDGSIPSGEAFIGYGCPWFEYSWFEDGWFLRGPVVESLVAAGTGLSNLFLGSGAALIVNLSASGTGAELMTAPGACSIAELTASGMGIGGVHVGNGMCDAAELLASGTGEIISQAYLGTGAISVEELTAVAQGKIPNIGSGATVIEEPIATGSGEWHFQGSGAPAIEPLTAAGAGAEYITGSGAASLSGLTAVGHGEITFIIPGSGACGIEQLSLSAVGKLDSMGSGAASISGLTAAGVGIQTGVFLGTGAVTLEELYLRCIARVAYYGMPHPPGPGWHPVPPPPAGGWYPVNPHGGGGWHVVPPGE